jgi:hypothetical protein
MSIGSRRLDISRIKKSIKLFLGVIIKCGVLSKKIIELSSNNITWKL